MFGLFRQTGHASENCNLDVVTFVVTKHSWQMVSPSRDDSFPGTSMKWTRFKCKRCGLTIPVGGSAKTLKEAVRRLEKDGTMVDCDERFVDAVMDD